MSFGLSQPGAKVAPKVCVILTAGNEADSAAMFGERPPVCSGRRRCRLVEHEAGRGDGPASLLSRRIPIWTTNHTR